MRRISIWANELDTDKNVSFFSLKRRENADDRHRDNLVMAKRLHLAFGFILLLCLPRTTRTFSGNDEGEFLRIINLIWHPSFEVSLVC